LAIIFTVSIIAACEKQDNNFSNHRLIAIEFRSSPDSLTGRTNFIYDGQDRIIQIVSNENRTTKVQMDVAYFPGEIRIVKPLYGAYDMPLIDTIRFIRESNERVVTRLEHYYQMYQEYNGTLEEEQWDTATFHYDVVGFMMKEFHSIRHHGISGATDTYCTVRRNSTITYTNSNGNLVRKHLLSISTLSYDNTPDWTGSSGIFESTSDYEYSKSFPNKMDFTNSIILNEWGFFTSISIDKHFQNLPEKITTADVSTSVNENSSYFYQRSSRYSVTYNSDGLLATISNPDTIGAATVFIYD
jgi:hypothetical protein